MSEQPKQQMSKFVHKLDDRESPRVHKKVGVPVKKAIENLKYFVGARRLKIPRSPQTFNVLKRKRELSHQVSKKAVVRKRPKPSSDDLAEDSFLEQVSRISNGGLLSLGEHSTNQETEDVPLAAYTSEEVALKHRYRSEERYVNEHMECELAAYKEEIEKRFEASSINKGYTFPRTQAKMVSPKQEEACVPGLKTNVYKKILSRFLSQRISIPGQQEAATRKKAVDKRFKSKDTSIDRGESEYSDKKTRLASSRSQPKREGSYGGLVSHRSPQVTQYRKNTTSSEEYAIEYLGTKASSSRNPQTILYRKEFKTQGCKEASSKLFDDGKPPTARPSEYYKTYATMSDKDPSSISSRNYTESSYKVPSIKSPKTSRGKEAKKVTKPGDIASQVKLDLKALTKRHQAAPLKADRKHSRSKTTLHD